MSAAKEATSKLLTCVGTGLSSFDFMFMVFAWQKPAFDRTQPFLAVRLTKTVVFPLLRFPMSNQFLQEILHI